MADYQGLEDVDQELAGQVKDALLRSTESAGIDINVAARKGTVRLTGIVDVLSHRTAAETIARQVEGVRRIENDITVANEGHLEDKGLTEKLTERLTSVPALRSVGCRVQRGRVELVGHVATKADETRAMQLAEATPAVVSVSSRIKVGEGRSGDEAVASRHAERLLSQMGFDAGKFEVYADAGTLFVKGFVRDEAQRQQVVRMMQRLDGVSRVEATLVTDAEFGGEVH